MKSPFILRQARDAKQGCVSTKQKLYSKLFFLQILSIGLHVFTCFMVFAQFSVLSVHLQFIWHRFARRSL